MRWVKDLNVVEWAVVSCFFSSCCWGKCHFFGSISVFILFVFFVLRSFGWLLSAFFDWFLTLAIAFVLFTLLLVSFVSLLDCFLRLMWNDKKKILTADRIWNLDFTWLSDLIWSFSARNSRSACLPLCLSAFSACLAATTAAFASLLSRFSAFAACFSAWSSLLKPLVRSKRATYYGNFKPVRNYENSYPRHFACGVRRSTCALCALRQLFACDRSFELGLS